MPLPQSSGLVSLCVCIQGRLSTVVQMQTKQLGLAHLKTLKAQHGCVMDLLCE
jgi:hypothetical protein